jgi:hypothetical protein
MKNKFGFYYPSRIGRWHFRWPWHVAGGVRCWVFNKWSYANKDSSHATEGITILGMTKIDLRWIVQPEIALKEYRAGEDRLVKWMVNLKNEKIWGD